jgi:uncharacterized cupin superfamily protein
MMPDDTARVPTPIAADSVRWEGFGEVPNYRSRWRHLTRAARGADYRIGVVLLEVPPGGRSAPFHYHHAEEEHLYVLEGTPTLRLGDARHRLAPGDYACFPAGQRAGHCLLNETGASVRCLVIGEQDPNDVIVYPDSDKVKVRALGAGGILDLGASRGYWEGEDAGLEAREGGGTRLAPQSTPAPKGPVAAASIAWDDVGPGVGTRFGGRSRHLTEAAVGSRCAVGVLIAAPAPGRRLWPRHWHTAEEEHAYVLEGEVTLVLGAERHLMRPGDYVVFPAGQPLGHTFENSGDGPCSYLMIGNRDPKDACVYPDSAKVGISALPEEAERFSTREPLPYWHGEDLGADRERTS